jgi:predicted RNA binding protein YcfA (HicA-like mRNA interferase family)
VKIISGKRMCRVLEQRGWTLARINGSHHIYRHAPQYHS